VRAMEMGRERVGGVRSINAARVCVYVRARACVCVRACVTETVCSCTRLHSIQVFLLFYFSSERGARYYLVTMIL